MQRLSVALVLVFLGGCASNLDHLPKPAGFLCCNVWTDGKWISDLNVAEEGKRVIPVGTPAQVLRYGKHEVRIKLPDGEQTLGNDYSRSLAPESFARRYVVESDPSLRLATYTEPVRKAIAANQVKQGMSREQVLMALGYPTTSDTPQLDVSVWRYQFVDAQRFHVLWDGQGRVANVAAEAPVRKIVFTDAATKPQDEAALLALKKGIADDQGTVVPELAARLTSNILPGNGNAYLFPDDSTGCPGLFTGLGFPGRPVMTVTGATTQPDAPILVAGDKPARFTYLEVQGGSTCRIHFETQLAAGRSYAIFNGSGRAGQIGCAVRIVDEQTNQPVRTVRVSDLPQCKPNR